MTIGDLDAVEFRPEQILCHIGRIGESGTDRFETKHRRKDGVLIDVDVAATLLDPLEGRFVIFVRDTTGTEADRVPHQGAGGDAAPRGPAEHLGRDGVRDRA